MQNKSNSNHVSIFFRDFRRICSFLTVCGGIYISNLRNNSSSSFGFSKIYYFYSLLYIALGNGGIFYYQNTVNFVYVPLHVLIVSSVSFSISNALGQTKIIKLFKLLESYDASFEFHNGCAKKLPKRSKKHVPLIFWLVTYSMKLSLVTYNVKELGILTYCYTITSTPTSGFLVLYLFFSLEIKERFADVNDWLDRETSGEECRSGNLEAIRRHHLALTKCIRGLSEAFGPQLLVIFSCLVTFFLLSIYNVAKDPDHLQYVAPICIFFLAIIGTISSVTQSMITQSRQIVKRGFRVRLSNLNPASQFQMNYLCQQVMDKEEKMTCLDLFNIDMSFLGSFSTLLVTYTIAVLQIPA